MSPPELFWLPMPQNPNYKPNPSTETAGLHAQTMPSTNKQQTFVTPEAADSPATTLVVLFYFVSLVKPFFPIAPASLLQFTMAPSVITLDQIQQNLSLGKSFQI